MSAITPWSMLGARGGNCIAGDRSRADRDGAAGAGRSRIGPKKFAEPVAGSSTAPVDFPLRPLRAASYDLSVLLRPTPAPCSPQEGRYGPFGPAARVGREEKPAICDR